MKIVFNRQGKKTRLFDVAYYVKRLCDVWHGHFFFSFLALEINKLEIK